MWVSACGWACSSARQENFVDIAFRDWRKHHERFWLNFWRAFSGGNALSFIISEMTFFASASWFADTWAQGIGVFAGAIASFALTEFFVFFAFLNRWEQHERFWLNLSRAFAGGNAFSVIISEITFFASASLFADTWTQGVGVFAGTVTTFA